MTLAHCCNAQAPYTIIFPAKASVEDVCTAVARKSCFGGLFSRIIDTLTCVNSISYTYERRMSFWVRRIFFSLRQAPQKYTRYLSTAVWYRTSWYTRCWCAYDTHLVPGIFRELFTRRTDRPSRLSTAVADPYLSFCDAVQDLYTYCTVVPIQPRRHVLQYTGID